MALEEETGGVVSFERFWRWLKAHPNCILQAGTADLVVFDHELGHWSVTEDEANTPILQFILGKALVSEPVLETHNILFVQASLDPEIPEDQVVFELMVGTADENHARYHVRMAHGMDEDIHHSPDAH